MNHVIEGVKAARTAGELLGFTEKRSESYRRGHSFYYPKIEDLGSSVPSYLNNLTQPKDANSMKIRNLYPDQDYHHLVKKYRSKGELFEDPRFPASNHLLTDAGGQHYITYFGRRDFRGSEIQWMRPGVSSYFLKNRAGNHFLS